MCSDFLKPSSITTGQNGSFFFGEEKLFPGLISDTALLGASKHGKYKAFVPMKPASQSEYMFPVRGSLPPPPPHMVWSQNLRFAAFRMKTLYLQCFLHGGLLARSANPQIPWIFATNLPKTCYLQCFGFDIVE